jgi:hypothetical protein
MLREARTVKPYPNHGRGAREQVIRVLVVVLSEEQLESATRSSSLRQVLQGGPWPISSCATSRVTRFWTVSLTSDPRKTTAPTCEKSKNPYKTIIGEIKANTD